ncbi:YceI family protein [Poseidonibacter sp.]|uniref:YceI family protein n=1 Tax=Poseidonibacter sp. TaxID=2321188 RepID=UPI00359CC2BE
MNIKKLTLASALLVSSLFAGTYNVDKSHSNMGFKVKHMMISNVSGSFDEFTGTFEYDEKTNTLTSLSGEINVESINTANEKRDTHLKEDELFSAKKFPKINFKLTKIDGEYAYGDITLKGITKNIKLELENGGTVKDPWGNERAAFALSGKINRKDFGITWNKVLETGGVAVGEIVKLDIEVEGIKAK